MNTAAAITPAITVNVEDNTGVVITTDTSNVTLALSGGGNLGGTTTVTAVNGVATFSNISIAAPGTYMLTATDGSDTAATSASFTVSTPVVVPPGQTGLLTPDIAKSTLPPAVVAGKPTHGVITVGTTNSSPNKLKGTTTIAIYATSTGSIDASMMPIASIKRQVNMKPGKRSTFRLTVKSLPTSLANGTYTLLARTIDPAGNARNSAAGVSVVIAAPFVSLSASVTVVKPPSVRAGKAANLTVTLSNAGNIDTSGLASLNVGLSADGQTESDILLQSLKKLKVKAGKNLVIHLHFKVKSTQATGPYFMYFSISQDGGTATPTPGIKLTVI